VRTKHGGGTGRTGLNKLCPGEVSGRSEKVKLSPCFADVYRSVGAKLTDSG
jgi:hypothetical protein